MAKRRPGTGSERPPDCLEGDDPRRSVGGRVPQLDLPSVPAAQPDLSDAAIQRCGHDVEATLQCQVHINGFVEEDEECQEHGVAARADDQRCLLVGRIDHAAMGGSPSGMAPRRRKFQ